MPIERRGDHWVWIGGPVPPGSDAITIVKVISLRAKSANDRHLMRHELAHVRQWRELGILRFLWRYVSSYLVARWNGYGHRQAYLRIPLEIEAEEVAVRGDRTDQGAGAG